MRNYTIDDMELLKETIDINQQEFEPKRNASLFPCTCYLDRYYNNSYPLHWHDEMEIAYVIKGKLKVSIENRDYELQEGEGIFIHSNVLHSYSGFPNTASLLPNILFQPWILYGTKESVYWKNYMKSFIESSDFSHIILKQEIPWQNEILQETKKTFSLLNEQPYGYEFYVRETLSHILLTLLQNKKSLIPIENANQASLEKIRKMLFFIQEHYMEPIQIQQIADSAFISRRSCLRIFQTVIGISPKQYIINLRLQKVKQLLTETCMPISSIATYCGFTDHSYFSKLFREKEGMTPNSYRKKNRHV